MSFLPSRIPGLVGMFLVQFTAASGVAAAAELSEVRFVPNPSRRVPLAASIEFEAPSSAQATLRITREGTITEVSGGERWQLDEGVYRIPVLGLRPSSDYEIDIEIRDGGVTLEERSFSHRTPAPPANPLAFPPIDIQVIESERMEPGITFLSVRRRALGRPQWLTPAQYAFSTKWGMLLALDNQGQVVWWYESDARTAGIEHLQNGNILMHRADFSAVEIDLLGFTRNQYYAENRPFPVPDNPDAIAIKGHQTLHHQPYQLPNGDFLSFTANAYLIEDYYTSDSDPAAPRKDQMVMADTVIQFSPAGDQVWTWNTMDYLDPFRIGYDTFWAYWWVRGFDRHVDWTHANGVSYDENDDSVLISLRNQSAVLKIDRQSGDIKWILGRHDNWPERLQDKLLTPVGELLWPAYQHNPRITHRGSVILFDNRAHGGALAFEERQPVSEGFSRGVEYVVDEEAMTVRQVWSSADGSEEDPCFTNAMSDAWRLPQTNNYLVIHAFCLPRHAGMTEDSMDETRRAPGDFPYGGRILEYSGEDLVLRINVVDPNDLIQWEVYGGFRASGFY
ncbi:MAG: aryl-sulfate sulfotransferase [Pseudomonadota bacterium]